MTKRSHRQFLLAALAGVAALAGCDQPKGETADEAKPDEAKATATAKAKATGDGSTAAASGAPAVAPSVARVVPAGRSPVPTLDEWNSVEKEVTVKGSSALNCETKMVREWLRISCRGKNDTGGTPVSVTVTKGGKGQEFTFASGGVTSLVMPFIDGTNLEAVFSWSDKSHKLVAHWPHGAPQPPIIATFEGAKSPLDGTAGNQGLQDKLCNCFKQVRKSPTCEGMLGAPDADCERTYGNDCAMLLACARGEPSAFPRCRPGFKNGGVIGRCFQDCSGGGACPGGTTCQKEWNDICWPNDW